MATNRLEILKADGHARPANAFARYGLATEYANSGAFEEAVELNSAICFARDENYAAAYYHGGQALEKLGRRRRGARFVSKRDRNHHPERRSSYPRRDRGRFESASCLVSGRMLNSNVDTAAVAQSVVAPDCGSGCRGFKSHQPPHPRVRSGGTKSAVLLILKERKNPPFLRAKQAVVAQSVEHFLGKEEVSGSIPDNGSIPLLNQKA